MKYILAVSILLSVAPVHACSSPYEFIEAMEQIRTKKMDTSAKQKFEKNTRKKRMKREELSFALLATAAVVGIARPLYDYFTNCSSDFS